MEQHQIDAHIDEITKYQTLLNQTPKENKRKRIELLSEQLIFIGKLAAEFSEEYKSVYAERKRVQAEAEIQASTDKLKGGKEAHGEIAVKEWRQKEAKAYGDMKRWGNAFTSTREQLHALKFDLNIDIQDGSNNMGS